jgi:hypothetical protein
MNTQIKKESKHTLHMYKSAKASLVKLVYLYQLPEHDRRQE